MWKQLRLLLYHDGCGYESFFNKNSISDDTGLYKISHILQPNDSYVPSVFEWPYKSDIPVRTAKKKLWRNPRI